MLLIPDEQFCPRLEMVIFACAGVGMKLQTRLLITAALWLLLVVALGYWRMFHAWQWGSFVVFFTEYLPLLGLLLVILLVLESLYFRRRG